MTLRSPINVTVFSRDLTRKLKYVEIVRSHNNLYMREIVFDKGKVQKTKKIEIRHENNYLSHTCGTTLRIFIIPWDGGEKPYHLSVNGVCIYVFHNYI